MIALPMSAKLAGGAALVACLTLLTLWQLSERRADRLSVRLETTRADLSQCRENTAALETSLEAQNRAVQALRDEGAARVAETPRNALQPRYRACCAQARAQWLRDRPIAGETECERLVNVIDAARGRE
jgi:type II secretory pathway component PulM